MMAEFFTRKCDVGDGDENNVNDMSIYEKSGVWVDWFSLEDLVSMLWDVESGLLPAV